MGRIQKAGLGVVWTQKVWADDMDEVLGKKEPRKRKTGPKKVGMMPKTTCQVERVPWEKLTENSFWNECFVVPKIFLRIESCSVAMFF